MFNQKTLVILLTLLNEPAISLYALSVKTKFSIKELQEQVDSLNDYLQSNIAIYQYDYQKYFGASVSELEILKLKKQRFFKSIIALIYIYFNPKNQFSLVQRFSKVKEILNNDLVKKIFSEDALKQNLGRYDLAIFKAIQIKNIFKLYLYTLYSYYRNK